MADTAHAPAGSTTHILESLLKDVFDTADTQLQNAAAVDPLITAEGQKVCRAL